MIYTPKHGQRHEVEFYAEPSHNEFLDGIAQVLIGPDARWTGVHGLSFRCISISPDKRTYIIEEVDIWQSLLEKNPRQRASTKLVKIILTCETCGRQYDVWRMVSSDGRDGWTGDKHWLWTAHCPGCPPMSTDVWLASLGYYPERPTLAPLDSSQTVRPTASDSTIDMTDFD